MMKKLIVIGILVCNLFAIGGMDSLPDDEKSVATKLQKTLDLNKEDAFRLYKDYFQFYLNENHWQIHWFDNDSPANGKMAKSDQKTMFISLINDDRIINVSIVKFPKLNQLLIYTIETLPRKSSVVLKKFDNLENDDKFTKRRETSKFAYFSKKKYMSKVNIFVSSPVGAIQYVDFAVFNLHQPGKS